MSTKDVKDVADISDKNRQKRTIKVEKQQAVESVSAVHDIKITKSLDVAKRVFTYEEEEAGSRDPNKDLQIHKNVCAELRRVMQQVHQFKSGSGNGSSPIDLEELKVHGLLQFVALKKLNRIAHFRSKKVRDATSEAKLKVDQQHLKLQNLLYEVSHQQKEINKCLQFKSQDEDITLIPLDQFYKQASADILKNAEADNHRLTLARLDWELEQRKRLSNELKQAAGMKDKIIADVKTKRDFLESLQPKLANILQATKPVQDHLSMQFDTVRDQHRTAAYLPSPLYVLYMQATAYAEACDKNLSVTINGDVELARTLERTSIAVDDDDADDIEEQEKTAEKRHRRTSIVQTEASRLLKKHPLSVSLQIKCHDKSDLVIVFNYLISLNVATVTVKISPHESISTISGGDLMLPDTLLWCLYPDDYGNKSPNPANNYVLSLGDFTKHVSEVGRPFMWVQWLCGLQFLDEDPSKALVSLSASHMSETVKRLRQRVRHRLSLQKQLAILETNRIPVSGDMVSRYPAKVSSRLSGWKRTTYNDFIVHEYNRRFVETNLAKPEDMYFTCLIERGTVSVTANVVISSDYPRSTSLMSLAMKWRSTIRTALNDEAIREMEAELNVSHEEPWSNEKNVDSLFLANQMQHLLVCVDVYLETHGSIQSKITQGNVEFPQERICSRLTRGRSRSRPYVYKYQLCFFTQR